MKILVGSQNPVKIDSVKEAFSLFFEEIEVKGLSVDSGVSIQPVGDKTFEGAQNRAVRLKEIDKMQKFDTDYFVGIEGGISKIFNKWFAFGCMCIIDKYENIAFGLSPHFELPDKIVGQLINGEELGVVIDQIINQENTKQKNGAIGFFTNGIINRKELYLEGLKMAIIPFLHKQMFFKIN